MIKKYFVYGTLKKGFSNSRILNPCRFIQDHTIASGDWKMISLGGFPGVIPVFAKKDATPIVGEIYEVDELSEKRLDRLEGYPTFYQKTEFVVDDETIYMYILEKEEYQHYAPIETGLWIRVSKAI